MDFPNFENINEDNNYNHHDQENAGMGGPDEVQIENMEFNNNNNNNYQGFNDNYNRQNLSFSSIPCEDNQVNDINFGLTQDDRIDENERKRIEERKIEEEQRRAKIMKKMNDELRIKQESRDKALEYIENWRT